MAKNKNKEKHYLGKQEFFFNLLSLLILIGIGFYFGGRSFYYYGRQNIKITTENKTLNGSIISNNKPVTDGDGLYRDSLGYYFKGKVSNNYVLIGDNLFRIIRVNNDNTVKLISENYVTSFMWGDKSDYKNSNVRNWLEKTDDSVSGIYYDTIVNPKKRLVKTDYSEDKLNKGKVSSSKKVYEDYITTLTVKDYVLANGKSSYLNNGKTFYLLGLDEDNNNLFVDYDGSIQSCDSLEGYGIRSVFTLTKNTKILSGDGSVDNPYVIDNKDSNYIDSYIKLGNDIWKVFENKNGILKLRLYGYASLNGQEIVRNYSTTNSIFDLKDKNNIAYYLNTSYLNSLPYKDFLLDTDFLIGEISDDVGYAYKNIYKEKITCKVGLSNIFDYNSNNLLSDYFYINTTSLVGSMEYNTYSNGVLEEVDVRELRHVVPVVSISKDIIKGGKGSATDPYVTG